MRVILASFAIACLTMPMSSQDLPGVVGDGDTSIFTALPEQLSLKVVADRQGVDVLVIDQITRPTSD
jgi:uncharacterized protein (TIGR03435 family)